MKDMLKSYMLVLLGFGILFAISLIWVFCLCAVSKKTSGSIDDNIKYINVDAKITNVTRGKEFTDVVDTTYIVDIHGHMGKLEGIWGKEGDHLKISCYNGNVFREEITSK